MSYSSNKTASNSLCRIWRIDGNEVVFGGLGGCTEFEAARWIKADSSSVRLDSGSKGSMPEFSESLVRRRDLEQMCPEGVQTGSSAGRPEREQV